MDNGRVGHYDVIAIDKVGEAAVNRPAALAVAADENGHTDTGGKPDG